MSGSFDSPASLLANFVYNESDSPILTILTGSSGEGKTPLCMQLAEQARASGLVVAGLISPPIYEGGHKVAIDIVDQLSGESRRLAVRRGGQGEGFITENWELDLAVLDWGNQLLANLPACDLLILDELGPLELVLGKGLQAGLDLVDNRFSPITTAVIRPRLLTIAQERWPWGKVIHMKDLDPIQDSIDERLGDGS